MTSRIGAWIHDRSLTLVMLALFGLFLAGQVVTGWYEFNETLKEHGAAAVPLASYLSVGHPWEALFENWESEFLSVAAMVWLGVYLRQRWSPESKPVHAPHSETGR